MRCSGAGGYGHPLGPSCLSQAESWRDNGGQTEVDALVTDLGDIQKAANAAGNALSAGEDASGPEADLQSASASLQSDAQAAEADTPPLCIKGMRANYMAAMTDYGKAAADYENDVSELSAGGDTVALGDITAGSTVLTAGTKRLESATSALQAFENGQQGTALRAAPAARAMLCAMTQMDPRRSDARVLADLGRDRRY